MNEIFISCGEISGDIYAADLTRELLKQPKLKIWGMIGPESQKAGAFMKWSYEELKLMGLLEIIPALPRILRLIRNITREVVKAKPDAAVLIDSPDFNLQLAKSLRKSGYDGKIISLIPPTVWAWRTGRVKNLKRDFDLCLPLFSFEHEFLLSHGVNSKWKAHPLVHDLKNIKLPTWRNDKKIIALMPGSRRYDINFHLEILLSTAKLLRERDFLPVFSIAPGLTEDLADELRKRVSEAGFSYWEGEGRELMLVSEAVVGVSGTVAVEAMLLEKYMVVIYNMRKINYLILKKLVHAKNISIPNMLTGKKVYPELLCEEANPGNIVKELEKYSSNEIISSLREAKKLMGDSNAAEFWAESILAL